MGLQLFVFRKLALLESYLPILPVSFIKYVKGSKLWSLKSAVLLQLFYYSLPPSDKRPKFHKSFLLKSSHKNTPMFPSLSAFCKVAGNGRCIFMKSPSKVASQLPTIPCNLYPMAFEVNNSQRLPLLRFPDNIFLKFMLKLSFKVMKETISKMHVIEQKSKRPLTLP